MLPARHRLRRPADIRAAIGAARSGSRLLVVHATRPPTRAGSPARVGFVVSRAVGNAVVRNRVKRRLRALIADALPLPEGVDLVVRANPAAATATFDDLRAALDRCVSQAVAKGRSPVGASVSTSAEPGGRP